MDASGSTVWLAAGLRTVFARVDGALAHRDSLALSVPVAEAMARAARGPIDLVVWGPVVLNLAYTNFARELCLEAGLDPSIPAFTTIMQCSTSMVAAFEAAGLLRRGGAQLALCGGADSMSRVQIGLGQDLSDWLRRVGGARSLRERVQRLARLRPGMLRLFLPQVKNRATKKSMGEHCEEMAKTWNIGREEQDRLALESH